MTERPDDLERALTLLATRVEFPPTPDLAASVHAALVAPPVVAYPERAGRGWWRNSRQLALAAAIVLLVLIGVAAIPRARHAVADWLGLPGIHIVIERGQQSMTSTPAGAGVSAPALLFGQPVSLAGISRAAGFPVRVPPGPPLGAPDGAYVRQVAAGTMVSLIYRPRTGLPEVGSTGIGADLMEIESGQDMYWMVKMTPNDGITSLTVAGEPAFWLTGAEVYFNPDPSQPPGQFVPTRESGNVLLWARDGITYRLESRLDQAQALAIADALMRTPATPASTPPSSAIAPPRGPVWERERVSMAGAGEDARGGI